MFPASSQSTFTSRRRLLQSTVGAAALLMSPTVLCDEPAVRKPTSLQGPLRVHPKNPRYFTDDSGKPIYLTGSHTWPSLIDRGPSDPPPKFDFGGYLDLLEKHHHNFIRLWARHVTWYHGYGEEELHATPLAWQRTGPGEALDGKPKFDLTKFNEAYFERLCSRVAAAGQRGIYVSVMLFGGHYECRGGWRGNPFHARNNINGVDGDPNGDGHGIESHTLALPQVVKIQQAYVRKVVNTLNNLDNVLYEISNEGDESSQDWQYRLIDFIHDSEADQTKQHPVGMTALYSESAEKCNKLLAESPADWISPLTDAKGVRDIFPADGKKVSLLDSDHWWIVDLYKNAAFGREWIWKAFCRGHNPILMEHLPPQSFVAADHPLSLDDLGHVASRIAMGQTRRFAEKIDLTEMMPRGDLASTKFCLASPGKQYLVYLPEGGQATVDLSGAKGELTVQWHDPRSGKGTAASSIAGGARREVSAPFEGDAVLYLQAVEGNNAR